MPRLTFSKAARADLMSIARYTQTRWGREQRNLYLERADRTFRLLADNPMLGREIGHIRTGYRCYPVGSHQIFYQLNDDAVPAEGIHIVRILHSRMNVDPDFVA